MTQPKRFNWNLYGAAGDYSNCLPYLFVFSFAFTSVTWLYFFSFSLACFFFLHLFLTFLSLSLLSPLIKSFLLTYFLLSFSFYFQSPLMITQFNKLHNNVESFFPLNWNQTTTGLQRNKSCFLRTNSDGTNPAGAFGSFVWRSQRSVNEFICQRMKWLDWHTCVQTKQLIYVHWLVDLVPEPLSSKLVFCAKPKLKRNFSILLFWNWKSCSKLLVPTSLRTNLKTKTFSGSVRSSYFHWRHDSKKTCLFPFGRTRSENILSVEPEKLLHSKN